MRKTLRIYGEVSLGSLCAKIKLMQDSLSKIQTEYNDKIASSQSLAQLDEIFLELFGKNGLITLFPREFPNLPKEELKVVAPIFNQTKDELEQAIAKRRIAIREEGYQKLADEKLDLD